LDWEEIKFSCPSQRKWWDPHPTTPTGHILKLKSVLSQTALDKTGSGMVDILNHFQGQRYGCRRSEDFSTFVPCPEEAKGLSLGFQPWEASK
jgi:hypothetical protein